MLGLAGKEQGHTRPMTAQLDPERDESGPIWFFTAKDTAILHSLADGSPVIATFASKGHDLFASVEDTLSLDTDRATIDRLWNRHIAAWYDGGKDDTKLALLRFDPSAAEIWLDGSSLIAGVKTLIRADPKQDYKDKVAKVALR